MSRKLRVGILACFVLIGFLNCVLVEPAFACHKESDSAAPVDHGCLICNPAGHQWGLPQTVSMPGFSDLTQIVSFPFVAGSIEPPPGSIFHPPIFF